MNKAREYMQAGGKAAGGAEAAAATAAAASSAEEQAGSGSAAAAPPVQMDAEEVLMVQQGMAAADQHGMVPSLSVPLATPFGSGSSVTSSRRRQAERMG